MVDLLGENAGRQRLPVNSLNVGVFLTEGIHQFRGHHELVSGEEDDQLGIDNVAVQVRDVVDLRNGEVQAIGWWRVPWRPYLCALRLG